MLRSLPGLLLACLASVVVVTAVPPTPPTVHLDQANFTGKYSRPGSLSLFLGIRYAKPPINDLRFRLPRPIPAYTGEHNATKNGAQCPQPYGGPPIPLEEDDPILALNHSEDCLTLNVVKPVGATETSKLPVVVWIYGGGFEAGSTTEYNANLLVERSIALGTPMIYVSMNYRVSGFGFLASKEVKRAGVGNLGLQDQREALRWVKKYIGAFGGDHTKVTIWGESAGSISVALQMLTNNGRPEGLFRGAFMQSGSPIPVGDITLGQKYYDGIVSETNCSNFRDTLACLRLVSSGDLAAAIKSVTPGSISYQSLALAWLPRVDGVFLTDNPQQLVLQGKVANIPFVSGLCDDEGTFFSLANTNVTTDEEFRSYLKEIYVPNANSSVINGLARHYPDDPTQGSPFDTGTSNMLTPQYKRLAAFQGDAVFQAPRRFFLQQRSDQQHAWAYLSKRFKWFPYLGAAHATDIINIYGGGDLTNYLINFVNTLNPNGQGGVPWPRYTNASPRLLTFRDSLTFPIAITKDTMRSEAMAYLTEVTLEHPF